MSYPNGVGNDPFVDFPGEWALLTLGYTQPDNAKSTTKAARLNRSVGGLFSRRRCTTVSAIE